MDMQSRRERASAKVGNAPVIPEPRNGRAAKGDARPAAAIPALEKRRLQCYLALMLGDIVAVFASFAFGSLFHPVSFAIQHSLTQSQLLLPIFLTLALYNGSYSLPALKSRPQLVTRPMRALALSALTMVLLTYFSGTSAIFSRFVFVAGITTSLVAVPLMRLAMDRFVRWRCGGRVENVLIVNDGGPAVKLPGAFVADARTCKLRPDITDPLAIDRLGAWFAPMDRVLVTCPADRRLAWATALKGLSVEGEVIDDIVHQLGALGAHSTGGHGFLLVSHKPLGLRDRAIKRAFDLALTIPAIIVLSPLLIVVALLIRLQDGGPALFVQKRTGRSSRFFSIYKFRSMSVARQDDSGAQSASKTDARITRLGRFIRRTSIDELPQLFNVLRGDMSLVGPRPHAPGSQAGEKLFWEVDQRYWQRHTLKPGITGLAQIRGFRGATDTEVDLIDRLQADLQYLDGWSLWRDVGIIFATLGVVVHDRAF